MILLANFFLTLEKLDFEHLTNHTITSRPKPQLVSTLDTSKTSFENSPSLSPSTPSTQKSIQKPRWPKTVKRQPSSRKLSKSPLRSKRMESNKVRIQHLSLDRRRGRIHDESSRELLPWDTEEKFSPRGSTQRMTFKLAGAICKGTAAVQLIWEDAGGMLPRDPATRLFFLIFDKFD